MEHNTLAGWLIVAGLIVIAAQVVVSIIAAVKTKKEKDSPSVRGLGEVLGEILKALATAIPLGVLGFLLILIGLILGGDISIETLFPPAAS
jgi:hypothetical protein